MRCHVRGPEPFSDSVRSAIEDSKLPQYNKEVWYSFYAGQKALKTQIEADRKTVQEAMERIHRGAVPEEDPVEALRKRLSAQGAMPSARAGVIPLDGLTWPRHEPPGGPVGLLFSASNVATGKETTTFHPKDEMSLRVSNSGTRPVFFELVYVDSTGPAVVFQAPRRLDPNETYAYPRDRAKDPKPALTITPSLGTDLYILYASVEPLPAGVVLRNISQCGTDRVIHRWYDWPRQGGAIPDLTRLVKKTLPILVEE
jgi:hypothetical protein